MTTASNKLHGKTAVVTGAGGTLCSAMACDLARQGAAVALLGRTESKLQVVADRITRDGGRSIICVADVMDIEALRHAKTQVHQAFRSCEILINGAGGNQADAITATTEFTVDELEKPETRGFFNLDMDAFQRVIDVNIMGTVKPCQVFGEDMARNGGGVIINFASMTSYRPLTRVGAYAAAKAGICNLTQWLACYLAPAGIRVNAIAPGFFVNDRSRKLLFTPEGGYSRRGERVMQHTPMKRFGEADQLLGCLNWLIDDEAAGFVTGITVPVDGGFLSSSGL
jgi:NAD(P)-dependent dehydrogenase (short-subunit alcohol dehydrogenase family)